MWTMKVVARGSGRSAALWRVVRCVGPALAAAALLAALASPAAAQTEAEEPTTGATVPGYESGYSSLADSAPDSEEGLDFDYEQGESQAPQIQGGEEVEAAGEGAETTEETTIEEQTEEGYPAQESPATTEEDRYLGNTVPDTGGELPLLAQISGGLGLPVELLWVGVGALGAASVAFAVSALRSRRR